MKVLHLVGGNLQGGAARGAYWLHRSLRTIGVDSTLLADTSERVDDPSVVYAASTRLQRIVARARPFADRLALRWYKHRQATAFSTGLVGHRILSHKEVREADVLHLHWVNRGFVDPMDLRRARKPVVWTLRDMWPFTGGCHYSMGCDRYAVGCGRCPQLGSTGADLTSWLLRRKKHAYRDVVRFVGISEWIADEAKKSVAVDPATVQRIGNGIDCERFFPVDKALAREATRVSTAKTTILIGAYGFDYFYKGFDLFVECLRHLDRTRFLVMTFGNGDPTPIQEMGFETRVLGFIADATLLRNAYAAADVFVAPSRMEAFGKTVAEAMACGTPVVCFDATGPRDVVDHEKTGYRASPYDARDLARGIEWVAGDKARAAALGVAARAKVEREFDARIVARSYLKLYEEILNRGRTETARPTDRVSQRSDIP